MADDNELKAQATATQPVPADIPKGELGPLKEATQAAEVPPQPALALPEQVVEEPLEEEELGSALALEDDEDTVPSGEDEELLLGPSDFPDQPLTQGAMFGAGADRLAMDIDQGEFLKRTAERLLRTAGSDSVRLWATRVLLGE